MNVLLIGIVGLVIVAIIIALITKKSAKSEGLVLTEEFKRALHIMNDTDRSVFITGKAGTGKSTLIRQFIQTTSKKYVLVAPTGVAALNIGGSTIHSFFRFPAKIMTAGMINPDYERAALF